MVRVGFGALRKGGNEFSYKKNDLAVQSIVELVFILGSRTNTPSILSATIQPSVVKLVDRPAGVQPTTLVDYKAQPEPNS